jgi:DNA-directed RNA polymerase specialized sigma24 family protein
VNATFEPRVDELMPMVAHRARRLGVQGDSIADVQQDLVPALLAFPFDPSRGASPATALRVAIDNRVRSHLRREGRHRRRVSLAQLRINDHSTEDPTISRDRCLDVSDAIAQLDPIDAALCRAILSGSRPAELQRDQRLSRAEYGQRIRRIRTTFENCGLRAWVRVEAPTTRSNSRP